MIPADPALLPFYRCELQTACTVKHPFLQLFIYFLVHIPKSPHAWVHLHNRRGKHPSSACDSQPPAQGSSMNDEPCQQRRTRTSETKTQEGAPSRPTAAASSGSQQESEARETEAAVKVAAQHLAGERRVRQRKGYL